MAEGGAIPDNSGDPETKSFAEERWQETEPDPNAELQEIVPGTWKDGVFIPDKQTPGNDAETIDSDAAEAAIYNNSSNTHNLPRGRKRNVTEGGEGVQLGDALGFDAPVGRSF